MLAALGFILFFVIMVIVLVVLPRISSDKDEQKPKVRRDDDSIDANDVDYSAMDGVKGPLLNGREISYGGKGHVERGKVRDDNDEDNHPRWPAALTVLFGGSLLAVFLFVAIYTPAQARDVLNRYKQIALEEGIDKVSGADLEVIRKHRNVALFLDSYARAEFDNDFKMLQRSVEKWGKIKSRISTEEEAALLKAEGKDENYENSTTTYHPAGTPKYSDWNKDPNSYMDPYVVPVGYEQLSQGMGVEAAVGGNMATWSGDSYRPLVVGREAYLIRIGTDVEDIHPADFPIYEEYRLCMEALAWGEKISFFSIVDYDEYLQLKGEYLSR